MPIRAQHCPDNTLARRWRIRYRLARNSPVREWFAGPYEASARRAIYRIKADGCIIVPLAAHLSATTWTAASFSIGPSIGPPLQRKVADKGKSPERKVLDLPLRLQYRTVRCLFCDEGSGPGLGGLFQSLRS